MNTHKGNIDTQVRLVREGDETVTKRGPSSKGWETKESSATDGCAKTAKRKVSHFPEAINDRSYPAKNNINELGPTWQNIPGNHPILQGQRKVAFSYSDPGGSLGKIKQPKSLSSCNEELYVSKQIIENATHIRRQIMPNRNNNHRK